MSDQRFIGRPFCAALHRRLSILLIVALGLVASDPTSSLGASDPSMSVIGTDDMFGFTTGSDIGDAGVLALGIDSTWALGKRAGRFRAGSTNLDFRYNISDDLQVGIGANFDSFSIHDVPDLTNRGFTGFGGVTPSLRYRIIERSLSPGHPTQGGSPVGLTLSLEPHIGLLDTSSGRRARVTAFEARLSLDGALVPSRIYGAVNLSYEAERVRRERESKLALSAALTFQVTTDYFVGAEVRYQRAYDGLGLQSLAGQALHIGPTFFAKFGEDTTLSVAWSSQVAGKSERGPGMLDLDKFSRHEAKATFRVGF